MDKKVRVRTIKECADLLRAEDPLNRSVTFNGLRKLVADGKIPCIKVGRKTLLNYDLVRSYFFMEDYFRGDGNDYLEYIPKEFVRYIVVKY